MRSTLSAAVRLNVVGPYLSTQLLCHPVRKELVAVEARERRREISEAQVAHQRKQARTKAATEGGKAMTDTQDKQDEWAWADEAERGPATTWPLGEILAARHDLQHSRIFNS
jgi:urease accessory protein